MRHRHLRSLLPWLALLAALTACRSEPTTLPALVPTTPLIAASNLLHSPFSSRNANGQIVGIEIDLITETARRLDRELVWLERSFGELLPGVAAGRIDFAAATIGVTEERLQLVEFSKPYYQTSIVALVRRGKGEPKDLEDLRGRRIGTEPGTTAVRAAQQRIPEAVRVTERPAGISWAEMLAGGDIDAMVLDASYGEVFMQAAGLRFRTLEEPLAEEHFAIAVNKQDRLLLTTLDAVIEEHLE